MAPADVTPATPQLDEVSGLATDLAKDTDEDHPPPYTPDTINSNALRTCKGGDDGKDPEEPKGPGEPEGECTLSALKNLFGAWTREEAQRTATRDATFRQLIMEDRQAALVVERADADDRTKVIVDDAVNSAVDRACGRFESSIDNRLEGFARKDELKAVKEKLEDLDARVSALGHNRFAPTSQGARSATTAARAGPASRPVPPNESPDTDDEDPFGDSGANRQTPPDWAPSPGRYWDTTAAKEGESTVLTVSVAAGQRRQKGPVEYGLKELTPADSRFTKNLSYRMYRLQDTSPELSQDINRNFGIWERRLKHTMDRHTFSGDKPLAILDFLAAYREACDHNQVPESAAYRLCPKFMAGGARDMYESAIDDAGTGSGIRSWPEAVQFLLQVYATDSEIERATDKLQDMEMGPKETVMQFKNRITKEARALAGGISHEDQIRLFVKSLPTGLRGLVREFAMKCRTDGKYIPGVLQQIARHAEDLHTAFKIRPSTSPSSPRRTATFRTNPVSHVDGNPVAPPTPPRTQVPVPAMAATPSVYAVSQPQGRPTGVHQPLPQGLVPYPMPPMSYAQEGGHRELPGLPRPDPHGGMHPSVAAVARPVNSDYAPSCSDWTPSIEESQRGFPTQAQPWDMPDQCLAVDSARRYPQPYNNRWGQSYQGRQQNGPAQRQPRRDSALPIICFFCFKPGHYAYECEHRDRPQDDQFLSFQLANFRLLAAWIQVYLYSMQRLPRTIAPEDIAVLDRLMKPLPKAQSHAAAPTVTAPPSQPSTPAPTASRPPRPRSPAPSPTPTALGN